MNAFACSSCTKQLRNICLLQNAVKDKKKCVCTVLRQVVGLGEALEFIVRNPNFGIQDQARALDQKFDRYHRHYDCFHGW
mmetsp:Transcript_39769/g.77302  ORF Transcript_39769/g.77302 Transcript_39769/m.77302 type:complete len:80 (-) Transcript_39769:726-965(-)